ncbi:MAG: hypothetical protein HUJ63_09825, partial [Enterococcus sp.]|nr:hypothetical protein [Enterococcus sp.]
MKTKLSKEAVDKLDMLLDLEGKHLPEPTGQLEFNYKQDLEARLKKRGGSEKISLPAVSAGDKINTMQEYKEVISFLKMI